MQRKTDRFVWHGDRKRIAVQGGERAGVTRKAQDGAVGANRPRRGDVEGWGAGRGERQSSWQRADREGFEGGCQGNRSCPGSKRSEAARRSRVPLTPGRKRQKEDDRREREALRLAETCRA